MSSSARRAKKVQPTVKTFDISPPDISIVLAVYREANYLARTLQSVEEAVAYAQTFGLTFELIVTLDDADERTRAAAHAYPYAGFTRVEIVELHNQSLGLSRNDGIALARGTYVSTCDSDDLISYNSYRACWEAAQTHGEMACIYPEYLFLFGGPEPFVHRYYGSQNVPATLFLDQHPYTSRIFALRALLLSCPYQKVSHLDEYAYEDWLLNSDLLAMGCTLEVAPHTVVYYRQRLGSLARKFERTVRLIPPSKLFDPPTYMRLAAKDVRPDSRKRTPPPLSDEVLQAFLADPVCDELTYCANRIDPGISPQDLRFGSTNRHTISPLGDAYYAICRQLVGLCFDDIVLLPYMTTGGGEKYILNVMHAISELNPSNRALFVFGEPQARHFWLDRLPPNSDFVDLPALLGASNRHLVNVLALRVIQMFGPKARLHAKTSPFIDALFSAYGKLLRHHSTTYYRFSDPMYVWAGRQWFHGANFNPMSENIDFYDRLVTDHQGMVERDRRRFGVNPEKWRRLYTYCDAPAELAPRDRTRRLLWASRLAHEKRPPILVSIARRLATLGIDVHIDVYGREAQYDAAQLFEGLENVTYLGAYDSVAELNIAAYDALIYTTSFDGLPNIVLEMLGLGVPVVAPSIGGIGEAVRNGETGFLLNGTLDDDNLVDAYVDTILTLYREDFDHEAMRRAGHALIRERHGWPAFVAAVPTALDIVVPPKAAVKTAAKREKAR